MYAMHQKLVRENNLNKETQNIQPSENCTKLNKTTGDGFSYTRLFIISGPLW